MKLFELFDDDKNDFDYSLSNTQKSVLCRLYASATPVLAYEEVSSDEKSINSRDSLIKAGLIKIKDNEAYLTIRGKKTMREHNLIDDSGELTEDGKSFVNSKNQENNNQTSL